MANPWFKFYAADYLVDPKMLSLTASMRSCWITLLAYACEADDNGAVRYITEEKLMIQAGIKPMSSEWSETTGVLDRFQMLGMIEKRDSTIDDNIVILNWEKRQESYLTTAERQAKFRAKQKSNADVTHMSQESNGRLKSKIKNKSNTEDDLPDWLNRESWANWVQYRTDIRKKLTPQSIKLQIKKLAEDIPHHKQILEQSIQNGWTGLFPIKSDTKRPDAPKEPSKYKNVKVTEA